MRALTKFHALAARAVTGATRLALVVAAAALAPLTTLTSDARADDAPLRVCATTPDLGALVRAVGGDDVTLTVFVKGTEDPHYAEAKPSFVKALHDADLLVQNGLDLELGYVPVLLQQARNPRIAPGAPGFLDGAAYAGKPLDVPTGVVDRSMGDVHASGNPHYLLDPMRGIAVASAIAARLGELRPERKAAFASRLDAFRKSVYVALVGDALAARYGDDVPKLELLYRADKLGTFLDEQGQRAELGGWLGAMLPHRGAKAVDDHRLWAYFADAFGLEIVEHLEPLPGVPPTTKHLEAVIATMKRLDVKLVLASAYYDPRYADLVAKNTGAAVARMANQVDAVPGTGDYVAMLSYDVKQVVTALEAAGR
jgi:zinc/manganese transport system substrate-binding protein